MTAKLCQRDANMTDFIFQRENHRKLSYDWCSDAGVQKTDAGVGIGTLIGDRDHLA